MPESAKRVRSIVSACGGLARVRSVTALAAAAGTLLAASAWAQPPVEKPKDPPLDINAIQPGGKPAGEPAKAEPPKDQPAKPESKKDAAKPEAPKPEAGKGEGGKSESDAAKAAIPEDTTAFQVSRFLLEYRSPHPNHPAIEELLQSRVVLGVSPTGYVAPREGLPEVEMRIADVAEGSAGVFYRSAVNEVGRAVVGELSRRGYMGIFVMIHPEDVDFTSGADKRGGSRSELRLIVWTGKVKQVRTISSGERLEDELKDNADARVDNPDPVHARIRAQSPVQEGDLLRKDQLDDFVFRLNRHPARRVDIAIAPGSKPEDVVVDYLVTEGKPWSAYVQLSNTGTRTTTEWRERFGFVHNQLTGHDDILRVDYSTGGFQQSHAFIANYEFPILSDRVRLRANAGYTRFEASDIGLADEEFSGEAGFWGLEATGTVYQFRELFVDLVGGVRYKSEKVTNDLFDLSGRENFFFPYVGVNLDRNTDASSTRVNLTTEFLWEDITGVDPNDIENMGRLGVDTSWTVLKFDLEHSFFVEPLLNPKGYKGEQSTGPQTLAHEFAGAFRGQYSFGNRLVPSEEAIAGGLFTVRGYPESTVSGDTVLIGSLEYRFHVPRVFGVEDPGKFRKRPLKMFGDNFRYQPQQPFGRADWDWVLKAFVDAAKNTNASPLPGEENFTLIGAGIGTELQWKRNVSMRLDWGVALKGVDDAADPVDSGNNEFHFSLTLLY